MPATSRQAGSGCSLTDLSENDLDHLRFELAKTEDEIQTLRQVLLAKEKYAADIRRQLGMSPVDNLKQNLSKGWQEVQTSAPYLAASATLEDISHSSVYVRTRDGFSQAGQITSAVLSNVGEVITRRLARMSNLSHTMSVPTMRHSSTFRSFEEMVGNVKVSLSTGQYFMQPQRLNIDDLPLNPKDKVTGGLSSNGDTSGFERRYTRNPT